MSGGHIPVLLDEVLELLTPQPGDVVLDGTVGGGGHAKALLQRLGPSGRLVGLDRDEEILNQVSLAPPEESGRCILRHADFADLASVLDDLGIPEVNVVLLDLGVSSFQLEDPQRGFSFQQDGPLDMRLDRSEGRTATDLVNELDEEQLAEIFRTYGDERFSRQIAARIVRQRQGERIETTGQLVRLVLAARPAKARQRWQRIHPATRVFQSLRIFLNREVESLERFCGSLPGRLAVGGRVGIISFHSGEDRIVKRSFKHLADEGVMELLTRKPVTPGQGERRRNPRSRSAKLRVARRIR